MGCMEKMKICYGSASLPRRFKKGVVTLGVFDGVHKGHREIIKQVVSRAKRLKAPSLVYSFDPHPVRVLAPIVQLPLLNTIPQRGELIRSQKIDCLLIEPFSKTFAKIGAKDFFNKILLGKLEAREIFVGYDFTFGSKRSGTIETLEALSKESGVKVTVIPALFEKGCLISSTEIRHAISRGELKRANLLLGGPFFIDGDVVRGRGVGKALGIHTANVRTENEIIPMNGVYASYSIANNKRYKSVTNIGHNPTFGGSVLSIETHILNFKQNLYRKRIRVEFIARLRDERLFSGPEALKEQIMKDIKAAKKILSHKA
jgi:riboflavin kinase / FMN adenylyltransferase